MIKDCKKRLLFLKDELVDAEYDYERVSGDDESLSKVRDIRKKFNKTIKKCKGKLTRKELNSIKKFRS